MHDTDPFERPTTLPPPVPRAARKRKALVIDSGFFDKTPTTAPMAWQPPPAARLPRIARGTVTPELARALAVSAGVRPVEAHGPWGWVRRVSLDEPLEAPIVEPAPAPVARPTLRLTPAPLVAVLALVGAYFVVLLSADRPSAGSTDVDMPAPRADVSSPVDSRPVVTPILEPTVEPIVAPIGEPTVAPIVEPMIELEPDTVPARSPAKRKLAPARAAPAKLVKPAPAKAEAPAAAATPATEGLLMVSAKPPCRILVDGRDTGRTTPVRDLRLSAGSHEITLVNDEFGIRETTTVEIGDKPARLVRNLLPE